jgi:copper transport protein
MRQRLLPLVLAVLALTLGWATLASAHAALKVAYPTPDAIVAKAPLIVELTFTEEVEAQFGAVSVYDQTGARVDKGDAALDPKDVTRVLATLQSVGDGLYTVSYRVISADGHPISGSYGFTVGKGIAGAAYYQPAVPETGGRPPAGVLAGYWLAAAGLLAFAGLSLVQGLVVRGEPAPALARWLWAAWGAALGGTLVYLVFRTAQAAGVSPGLALNPALLGRMLLTRTGMAVLGRLVLLAATSLLMGFATRRWWLGWLIGELGLLTVAMGGHAVALAQPVTGVGLDWLHLTAAAAWGGGLLHFAFLVRTDLGNRVKRFSGLAALAVAVLAGTGLYPVLLHVPSVKALTRTLYGTALMVKLGLVAGLLLLGAANLVIVGPALRRGQDAGKRLRWLVTAEAVLMACVLAVTALLTNVAPARVALPPETLNVGIHTQAYAAAFRMSPLLPGYRTVDVELEAHEGTLEPETRVTLELIHTAHDMGKNVTEGKRLADGTYRFEQVLVGMPGDWLFVLHVDRPGRPLDDVKLDVTVPEM